MNEKKTKKIIKNILIKPGIRIRPGLNRVSGFWFSNIRFNPGRKPNCIFRFSKNRIPEFPNLNRFDIHILNILIFKEKLQKTTESIAPFAQKKKKKLP